MGRIKIMNARNLFSGAIATALFMTMAPYSAVAQEPTRIEQHKAWGAYTYQGQTGKVCYVLSVPTDKKPADRDHGDVFFMLARHPGQANNLEPQFAVGYPFKENSQVNLNIDGKQFDMYTKGQNAWLANPAKETEVVAAMRAGRSMSLSAESRRGTQTSYTYSLSGVTASLREIDSCK